jgi:hypothetical protein
VTLRILSAFLFLLEITVSGRAIEAPVGAPPVPVFDQCRFGAKGDSTSNDQLAECNSLPLREGARIRRVSEDQTTLLFECEDESILDVTIVDRGNSVIVREKNGQVEYLG